MSKIPCDVIKDLLPLYEDDICSERSKDMVEEHLSECEDCRDYLEAIHEELPPVVQTDAGSTLDDDIKFVKHVRHKISFRQIIIIAVFLFVVLIWSALNEYASYNESLENFPLFDKRVSVENVQVTDLYQLENGNIYCTLKSSQPFNSTSYGLDVPADKALKNYNKGKAIITFRSSLLDRILYADNFHSKESYVFSLKETLHFEDDENFSVVHEGNSIYYKGKGGKSLLIWKEGQKIKKAPDKIEQKVQDEKSGIYSYDDEVWVDKNLFIFDDRTK